MLQSLADHVSIPILLPPKLGLILRHESLEEEDNGHDVSLKPFVGTLRVSEPVR